MVTGTGWLDGVCALALGLIAPNDRAIQIAAWIFFIPNPFLNKTVEWSPFLLLQRWYQERTDRLVLYSHVSQFFVAHTRKTEPGLIGCVRLLAVGEEISQP